MKSLLKNKYVLYAVSALAAINVLGYLSIGSVECLAVFAASVLACQQYNKNMIVCLLVALFAANVVFGCGRIKENFEGMDVKGDLHKAGHVAKKAGKKIMEEEEKPNVRHDEGEILKAGLAYEEKK